MVSWFDVIGAEYLGRLGFFFQFKKKFFTIIYVQHLDILQQAVYIK